MKNIWDSIGEYLNCGQINEKIYGHSLEYSASTENELTEQLLKQIRNKHPVPTTNIPRFYFPKRVRFLLADDGSSASETLHALSLKASKQIIAEKKNDDILSNDDLDLLWKLFDENSEKIDDISYISFRSFCSVCTQIPVKAKRYIQPSLFLRFRRENDDKADTQSIFNLILRRASLLQERVCFLLYESSCNGTLSETDLERYISDLIPTFPQLESLEPNFKKYYLMSSVRKFFFYLDIMRANRISIRDILVSPILSEFFELQQPDLQPNLLLSNWFSLYSSLKVYGQFVDLDVDRNGTLSVDELLKFARGRYTATFLRRIFEECQTIRGEIDYRGYLTLVLVLNDIHSSQSISYIFKLLDYEHKGFLDQFQLMYFIKDISQRLFTPLNLHDFLNEIFDMANAIERNKITLSDLQRCGIGGTILSLLIDVHSLTQNQAKES